MKILFLIVFLIFLSALTYIFRRQEKIAAKRLKKEKNKKEIGRVA